MAAYSLDVLIRKWSREELSLEQAMGQVLQILQKLDQRLKALEGQRPRARQRPAPAPPAEKAEQAKDLSEPISSEPEGAGADDSGR